MYRNPNLGPLGFNLPCREAAKVVTLDVDQLYAQQEVAEELSSRMKCSRSVDIMRRTIVHRFVCHIASESLHKEVFRWPKDWREAFKERWFPRWLKKWFPVKWVEHEFEVKAFYPKVSIPSKQHTIKFRINER